MISNIGIEWIMITTIITVLIAAGMVGIVGKVSNIGIEWIIMITISTVLLVIGTLSLVVTLGNAINQDKLNKKVNNNTKIEQSYQNEKKIKGLHSIQPM